MLAQTRSFHLLLNFCSKGTRWKFSPGQKVTACNVRMNRYKLQLLQTYLIPGRFCILEAAEAPFAFSIFNREGFNQSRAENDGGVRINQLGHILG